jgi:hypothetical protein
MVIIEEFLGTSVIFSQVTSLMVRQGSIKCRQQNITLTSQQKQNKEQRTEFSRLQLHSGSRNERWHHTHSLLFTAVALQLDGFVILKRITIYIKSIMLPGYESELAQIISRIVYITGPSSKEHANTKEAEHSRKRRDSFMFYKKLKIRFSKCLNN